MFPETITVNVTQAHIDRGTPEHCSRCPIALATLDAIDTVGAIEVDMSYITLRHPGAPDAQYLLPDNAWRFICHYDTGKPVEPFSFTVEREN